MDIVINCFLGSIIFAFIIGFIFGTRRKESTLKETRRIARMEADVYWLGWKWGG